MRHCVYSIWIKEYISWIKSLEKKRYKNVGENCDCEDWTIRMRCRKLCSLIFIGWQWHATTVIRCYFIFYFVTMIVNALASYPNIKVLRIRYRYCEFVLYLFFGIRVYLSILTLGFSYSLFLRRINIFLLIEYLSRIIF